ncbi:MAG: GntR family transcriptional regulator [Intestinibacillus sp.]
MDELTKRGKASLGETVYQYILKMILTGEIACGERIPEDSLALRLGISRTPIREALRRLHGEGLINIYPKRFAEVISFTENDIRNLGMIRLNQDILAAQLAIYHGSNADFDRLHEMSERCRYYCAQDDLYMKIKADAEFHLMLSEISGNPLLHEMQETLYKKVSLLMAARGNESSCQIALHDDIVRGLKERNTELVVNSLTRHLSGFYHISGLSCRLELQQGVNKRAAI